MRDMKENKYDDQVFFRKYSEMSRSRQGLSGAGEWSELQRVLLDFRGKKVLDLGCGYGWHCMYAAQNGADSVLGTDISEYPAEQRICAEEDCGATAAGGYDGASGYEG